MTDGHGNHGGKARERRVLGLLLCTVVPLLVLGPCLLSGRQYLSFDLGEFPPEGTKVTAAEAQARNLGANKDATESPTWFEPELQMVRESLERRELPEWNPYAHLGTSLSAHGHLGLANPLHWPVLLTPSIPFGLWLLSFEMFALCGILTFGLLGRLGLSPRAAFFGALAAALSGTMSANGHWFMRMEPLALLPGMLWALLALRDARGRTRIGPAVGLAVAFGLTWCSGFPPYAAPVSLIAGLWGFGLAVAEHRRAGARAAGAFLGVCTVALLLGVALALAQVWPQLEFFPVSNRRPEPDATFLSSLTLDPIAALGYLLMEPFGHPAAEPSLPYKGSPFALWWSSQTHWETGEALESNFNFTEYAVYPGTMTLVLGGVGLVVGGAARWVRWAAAGTFAALFALALAPAWLRWVWQLPVLDSVPPMRFVGPAHIFLALLAGLGFHRMFGAGAAPGPRLLNGAVVMVTGMGVLLLSLGWYYGGLDAGEDPLGIVADLTERFQHVRKGLTTEMLRQFRFTGPDGADLVARGYERIADSFLNGGIRLLLAGGVVAALRFVGHVNVVRLGLPWVVVVGTAVELGVHGARANHGVEGTELGRTAVHDFLREHRDARVDEGGFAVVRIGSAFALPYGSLYRERIRDLGSYTFFDAYSSRVIANAFGKQILSAKDDNLLPFPDTPRLRRSPLLDAMGVRYVLSAQPTQHQGQPVGPVWEGPEGRRFFVYERPGAMPRAWFVPKLRVADDPSEVVSKMNWKPRVAAVVSAEAARVLGSSAAPEGAERAVRFVHDRGKRIRIDVGPGPAGFVVIADADLPGWTARIGGEPVAMARGNGCMRVIPVASGPQQIRLRYKVPGLRSGLAVTGLAWGCVFGLLAWIWIARRRESKNSASSAMP